MDLGLADKTALVTGATSVMGAAIAELLVAEGVAVMLVDESVRALDELMSRLKRMGGDVQAAVAERNAEALRALVADRLGGFHVAWLGGLADDQSLTDVAKLVDATANRIAAQGGGSIVLQSTTAAFWDVPGATAEYAAMGAAIAQIARQVSVRRASEGVRVNAVCPGGIDGGIGGMGIDEAAVPLAGIAPASDVADVAAFLLSPLSGYTTSQAIVVDGGASVI
ncbi:SDR family NAD(P)-dependent oxidoreductase [Microbacterium sp. A588]